MTTTETTTSNAAVILNEAVKFLAAKYDTTDLVIVAGLASKNEHLCDQFSELIALAIASL